MWVLAASHFVANKELIAHELTHVIQQNRGKKLPRDGKNKLLVTK